MAALRHSTPIATRNAPETQMLLLCIAIIATAYAISRPIVRVVSR